MSEVLASASIASRVELHWQHCRICSAPTKCRHNGIWACRACAIFYRRNFAFKNCLRCSSDNKCRMTPGMCALLFSFFFVEDRSYCQACRMARCVNYGMRIDGEGIPTRNFRLRKIGLVRHVAEDYVRICGFSAWNSSLLAQTRHRLQGASRLATSSRNPSAKSFCTKRESTENTLAQQHCKLPAKRMSYKKFLAQSKREISLRADFLGAAFEDFVSLERPQKV